MPIRADDAYLLSYLTYLPPRHEGAIVNHPCTRKKTHTNRRPNSDIPRRLALHAMRVCFCPTWSDSGGWVTPLAAAPWIFALTAERMPDRKAQPPCGSTQWQPARSPDAERPWKTHFITVMVWFKLTLPITSCPGMAGNFAPILPSTV